MLKGGAFEQGYRNVLQRIRDFAALSLTCLCAINWVTPAEAQSGSPASPPDAATAAPIPSTTFSTSNMRLHGLNFSGVFDGYYSFNNNHPASGLNNLYNFDDHADQVDLNMLKLTVSHDADPVGFRVDTGFGRAFQLLHNPVPSPGEFRFIEQAYVSLKPKSAKGLEIDLGAFVSPAGSEVTETAADFNYSRSYLFALGPYYHFGIRTSIPVTSSLSVGLQLVNGWNAIVDQYGNNMQTVGVTQTLTRKKFTWSNNYYVGSQNSPGVHGERNFLDTALLLTPIKQFSAYVNVDYGRQQASESNAKQWWGIAAAARWQITKRIAVSPRLEYFDDLDGFTTGKQQKLHEVTLTAEYKLLDGLLMRGEFRRDNSNMAYFDRGNTSGLAKTQSTATLGLIAFFPIKH